MKITIPKQEHKISILKRESTDDDKQCRLRFIDCHKKFPLEELNKKELKVFIQFAKKIEVKTWKDIKFNDNSLNYEIIKNKQLPLNSNGIIDMESLRVDGKFRVVGYRDSEYFYIVWFDKNHKAY
jgi:hypothetical protein